MKFSFLKTLSLCSLCLFCLTCDPSQGPELPTNRTIVNLKLVYDGQPVVFDAQPYGYDNGTTLNFSDFKFYVSNLTLLAENGRDEIDLSEIRLLDFSTIKTLAQAQNGISFVSLSAPVGHYSGVKFNLGVSPELNKGRFVPDAYAGTHPLNRPDMHSGYLKSYKFLDLAGTVDSDGDGEFDDASFNYETGTTDLYLKDITFDTDVTVKESERATLTFMVDLHKVLKQDGTAIDVLQHSEVTVDNLETLGKTLMDNLKSAISIQ